MNLNEIVVNDGIKLTAKLSSEYPGFPATRCVDGNTGTMCHSQSGTLFKPRIRLNDFSLNC